MSIASLVLVALMAFVLIAPLAMVAVLVFGVPRHLSPTASETLEVPAPRPTVQAAVAAAPARVAQPAAA